MGFDRLSRGRVLLGNAVMGPDSVLAYRDITIAHAAILTLRATPVTLVPAPGAGKIAFFDSAILVSAVPTTVYVESTANLVVRQTGTTGVIVSEAIEITASILTTTGNKATTARQKVDQIGIVMNAPLVLHNSGAGEYTGGAAANSLVVRVFYTVQKLNVGTLV